MKKTFNILILFIGVFLFNMINVKALEFPINVESDGVSLSITGVDIKVYDFSNGKIEDYANPYKTINVGADTLTINPKVSKIKYDYFPEMISVNLNLSHPSLEALLTAGAPINDDSKVYKAIVVVNYKINKIPNGYRKIKHYNLLGNTSKSLYNVEDSSSVGYEESQWIGMGTYSMKDGHANLDYNLLSNESMRNSLWDFDLMLTDDVDFSQESILNKNGLAIFIHNFSDLNSIIGQMQDSWFSEKNGDSDSDDLKVAKKIQTIKKVPDTAADDNSRLLLGMSVLLVGSAIVILELRKKQN